MNKKHIITISGDLASGKGVVSILLQKELGYEIYRNGEYFRKLAKQKGMDIKEFNIYVIDHPEIDRQVELSAKEYAQEHDNLIVDARLGWYAIPDSFKVYLKTDLEISAIRAMNDPNRVSTEKYNTIEEAKKNIKERYDLETARYLSLYGVHRDDMSNYDLVIDTTNSNAEATKNEIMENYTKWLEE